MKFRSLMLAGILVSAPITPGGPAQVSAQNPQDAAETAPADTNRSDSASQKPLSDLERQPQGLLDSNLLTPQPDEGDLSKLRRRRFLAANSELAARIAEYKSGRSNFEVVARSMQRLVGSFLVLKTTPNEKARAFSSLRKAIQDLEKVAQLNVEHGTGTVQELHRARYLRLDALIQLAKHSEDVSIVVPDADRIAETMQKLQLDSATMAEPTEQLTVREATIPFDKKSRELVEMLPAILDAIPLTVEHEAGTIDQLERARYNSVASELRWLHAGYAAGLSGIRGTGNAAWRLVHAAEACDKKDGTELELLQQYAQLRELEARWARLALENGTGTVQDVARSRYWQLDAARLAWSEQNHDRPDETSATEPLPVIQTALQVEPPSFQSLPENDLRKRYPTIFSLTETDVPAPQGPANKLKLGIYLQAAAESTARWIESLAGRAPLPDVVAAAMRLRHSRLALEESPANRKRILDSFIEYANQIEHVAKLNLENGIGTTQDLQLARYLRFDSMIERIKNEGPL